MSAPVSLDAAERSYLEARKAIAHYRLQDARDLLADATRYIQQHHHNGDGRAARELGFRIELTQTWLMPDSDGLKPAVDAVMRVKDQALAHQMPHIASLAHVQASILQARAGANFDALESLILAESYVGEMSLDDHIRILLNKGAIGAQAGAVDDAVAALEQAVELSADLPEYRFMALHNLGFNWYLRGNFPEALRLMAEADALETPVDRSVAHFDRARVLMEAGLLPEAKRLLATSVKDLETAGLTRDHFTARLELARCTALLGNAVGAIDICRAAITELEERGETSLVLEARGLGLEIVLLALESSRGAEMRALIDPDILDVLGERTRVLRRDALEHDHTLLADRAAALAILADPDFPHPPSTLRALGRLRMSPHISTRMLGILAQLKSPTLSPKGFWQLIYEAQRDVTAARHGVHSLDVRTAMASRVMPIVRTDLQHSLDRPDDAAWQTLITTELWRTALESLPSVVQPTDDDLSQKLTLLRQHHELLRNVHQSDADSLWKETRNLERAVQERGWATAQAGGVVIPNRPLNLEELPPAHYLSYFWTDSQLWANYIPPDGAVQLHLISGATCAHELANRVITEAAALPRAGLLTRQLRRSLDGSLEELEAVLLAPLQDASGPVVIAPSGRLSLVPWSMMPALRRRPVTLTASLASWLRRRSEFSGTPRVAVAAGPQLAHVATECGAVLEAWKSGTHISADAASVREALASYDVVHIAAHGHHRDDSPLFSSLQLEGGDLFAHELQGGEMRASLVVLSACSVGRTRLAPGDQALGFAAALMAMGVPNVVAPMADVPDEIAWQVMAEFHTNLVAGHPGSEALALASRGTMARSFTWFGSEWRIH